MPDDIVTTVSVEPLRRLYPHVDQVKDWAAAQTTRLLWDRVHDLEERLQAAEATITSLVSSVNTVNGAQLATEQIAKQAYALVQTPGSSTPPPGTPENCPDDDASTGVNEAPATGHVGVVPQTPYEAGRVIGGTANEYPLLLAPTADLATREAYAEELVRRMIWHLQLAGFTAGRQNNSETTIRLSKDKLSVQVDGELRAYDLFGAYDDFATAMNVQAIRVCPARYEPDAGIPD